MVITLKPPPQRINIKEKVRALYNDSRVSVKYQQALVGPLRKHKLEPEGKLLTFHGAFTPKLNKANKAGDISVITMERWVKEEAKYLLLLMQSIREKSEQSKICS